MRLVAAMLIVFVACSQPPAPAPVETQARPAAAPENGPQVVFPDGYVVHVELAADDELRTQGLMWRDQLAPNRGMLFLFNEDDEHAFWMKNTLIPLDMIWIDKDRRVAAVQYHVPPCKVANCPSYPPGVPSRYVLEVGGGVAEAHGVKAGDQLKFVQTDNVVVR
jgi:uncharacterized membrane protein (UPF0127 family)